MTRPIQSPSDRFPLLRRFAVLIIVAGGLVAYRFIKPYLPHEHPVAYRFDPDAAAVTELETSWTRADAPESEPVSHARYHFDPGTAPRELRATVRAPDGSYLLELTVTTGTQ